MEKENENGDFFYNRRAVRRLFCSDGVETASEVIKILKIFLEYFTRYGKVKKCKTRCGGSPKNLEKWAKKAIAFRFMNNYNKFCTSIP